MDYKKIIEEGKLIYSSRTTDTMFREWSLARTICNITYCTTVPLSKLDRVILLTLEKCGRIYENQLAKILGFNVEDDFNISPKRYADEGEKSIFQGILSQIEAYGLLDRKDHLICLSNIGALAIKKGVKYSFYNASVALMENFDLQQKESMAYKMFPFRDALGIVTCTQNERSLNYTDFDIPELEAVIYGEPSELVARLSLQCDSDIHIFKAEMNTESRLSKAYVDFRLYEYSGAKYPLVFHQNKVSECTNDLLFEDCNKAYINHKVHIGEYLFLVHNSDDVLDYQSMIPYMDVWNLDDFLSNSRLDWSDDRLFKEIAQKANGSHWSVISDTCPTDYLVSRLIDYKESLDWIVLSSRFEDNFVIDNATSYPWDFETLSSKRSAAFIKQIITIPELHKDIDWDWETILSKLDDEFVINNIASIPFNMHSVSERYLSSYPNVIASHPDKNWNWEYISKESDLTYLHKEISALSSYLQLEMVMPRVFASAEYAEKFCASDEFTSAIAQKQEWLQNRYNANDAEYSWTTNLINCHERFGFITWQSGFNKEGFECNKGISWSDEVFEQYKDRAFSIKGLIHISKSIKDNVSIEHNPNFKWMWDILSSREIVTQDLAFIEKHIANISFKIAIPLIASGNLSILYSRPEFRRQISEQNVWDKLTHCIEKNTILKNISDPNWDWHVITKNFCTTLNLNALEKYNVLDKLDWQYISKNVDTEKIIACIDKYIERWDWSALTERLDYDFIIDNLPEYYNYWDWVYIITKVLSDDDLSKSELRIELAIIFSQLDKEIRKNLWSELTARYSTEDLLSFIKTSSQLSNTSVNFEWNYSDLYNRRDFDINKLLTEYIDLQFFIDWDVLSESKALNKILLWDQKAIKDFSVWEDVVLSIISNEDYKWNFKYLSTLASINWCDKILQSRENDWDWKYLSEHSKCFSFKPKRPKEIIKNIRRFGQHLDFGILSKRTDMMLTSEMIVNLINYSWDWYAISSNKGFKLSAEFVQENNAFLWDWNALSSRKDCSFSPEFIVENNHLPWNWELLSKRRDIPFTADMIITLVDKEWNWKHITKRADLIFNEEMLPKLVDKDIDWEDFSRRDDFYPTMTALTILKDKSLDWDNISKRLTLPYEVIVYYKERLNWSILTRSNHIDLGKHKVLQTFKDNLDWAFVSLATDFKPSIDILEEFKEFVDWGAICNRKDIVFDIPFLDAFKDKVDWNRISQSTTVVFTQEIIDRYQGRWDWVALAENPAFRSSGIEKAYTSELNLNEFYSNLKRHKHGRPFVYHLTHMFNAIEIIKSRRILSRNRASELGLLKYDAAGSVVHRSGKAHPYARFYYRTGTQTQFYNECLGKQHGSRYFSRAESNGLPMCPMPVFFRFDLQEVLTKHAERCYYSTGNMQTGWARVYKVSEDPNNIDYVNLYSDGWNKEVQEKKQQEFLVKNEFDFSELKDYQIICYDSEETEILRSIFKNDPICKHIICVDEIGDRIFENENPPLKFNISKESIEINTSYYGNYIFQIESSEVSKIKINNPRSIKAIKGNIIQLHDYVSIKLGNTPFDIYYVNMNPYARSPRWLIYQYTPEYHEEKITDSSIIEGFFGVSMEDGVYSPNEFITSLELIMPKLEELYNTKVRHYVVKRHTELVCEQFERFPFKFNSEYVSIDMMRIVLALHDIGKAIDRMHQHEHTITLIKELWTQTPFTQYELKLAEILLKNDNMGAYFRGKLSSEEVKNEIIEDAKTLNIPSEVLLEYKMILYQCDISSYTKDAGGLEYLEHMFKYKNNEKVFDDEEGIIAMSDDYAKRYNQLKMEIHG